MSRIDDEQNFQAFLKNLNSQYESLGRDTSLDTQYRQIKTLISLEDDFRRTLIASKVGNKCYREFIEHIDNEYSILAAQPFFRERAKTFQSGIKQAIEECREKSLYKYRINWNFIYRVIQSNNIPNNSKLGKIANKIKTLRSQILEANIPLAISQCRAFWSKTPKTHMSFMDLLQVNCVGMLHAIDKFVPPKTARMTLEEKLKEFSKFRSMAIGTMTGYRIVNYNSTLIHYYPADKKRMYRARKILSRLSAEEVDMSQVVKQVNKKSKRAERTNVRELSQLLASTIQVSADMPVGTEDTSSDTIVDLTPDPHSLADEVENKEAIDKIRGIMTEFSIFETKILALKGMRI